jgi:hypothetical protein
MLQRAAASLHRASGRANDSTQHEVGFRTLASRAARRGARGTISAGRNRPRSTNGAQASVTLRPRPVESSTADRSSCLLKAASRISCPSRPLRARPHGAREDAAPRWAPRGASPRLAGSQAWATRAISHRRPPLARRCRTFGGGLPLTQPCAWAGSPCRARARAQKGARPRPRPVAASCGALAPPPFVLIGHAVSLTSY